MLYPNSMGGSDKEEKRLLVVDSQERLSIALRGVLGSGYSVEHVSTLREGMTRLRGANVDVVLLNWDTTESPSGGGTEREALLKAASTLPLPIPVIALTADSSRGTAVRIIERGAYDLCVQPLDVLELKLAVDHAHQLVTLARTLATARESSALSPIASLVGNSKGMQRVYQFIRSVAAISTPALISGESGTGKEAVARAIHQLSPQANKPFLIFPAADPLKILLRQGSGRLEKVAPSRAALVARGRTEEVQAGTVYVDEIGELTPPTQAKLLRVLPERRFERPEPSTAGELEIRLICGTCKNLDHMVRQGTVRKDLFYRVSVFQICLPPLRDRRDDIPVLAEHFCRQFSSVHKKEIRGLTSGFAGVLERYDWPGNVRELQNVIERSVIASDGPRLEVHDLPPELGRLASDLPLSPFHEATRDFKREVLVAALRANSGNKLKAARQLRISRSYLYHLMKQLHIPSAEEGTPP